MTMILELTRMLQQFYDALALHAVPVSSVEPEFEQKIN